MYDWVGDVLTLIQAQCGRLIKRSSVWVLPTVADRVNAGPVDAFGNSRN